MGTAITVIVLLLITVGGIVYFARSQATARQRQLDDAKADARRR